MRLINSTDLDRWGDKECQVLLPELVRRLIRATGKKFDELRMPSGDGTALPGWDGEVNCANEIHTISAGWSLWEIGTEKEAKGKAKRAKADGDYIKRTENPLGYNPKEATFVFVTNRKWPKALNWAQEKRKEGIWKDVKAFAAEELVEWIELCPAVELWLAAKLGKVNDRGIEIPELFWERWSKGKKYSINPSIMLGGRDEEVSKVVECADKPQVLYIQEASKEMAKAFVVAAMLQNDVQNCIIAEDEKDALQVLQNYENTCVVTYALGSWNYATEKGNSVIVVVDKEDRCPDAIKLSPIDRHAMAQSLREIGVDIEKSERLVAKAGGNVMALRRLLKIDSSKPAWANSETILDLLPAILVGTWDMDHDGDKSVVAAFAGCSYDEYIKKIRKYLSISECPIKFGEQVYRVLSPCDTLYYIEENLCDTDLESLSRWLKIMLSVDADILYSPHIRHGILKTYIYLSSVNKTSKYSRILADYLQNVNTEELRYLEPYLTEIAEAAPADFLEMVEKHVANRSEWIRMQFGENEFKYYHYHSLLFALETIAWDKKYMGRVADILVRLMPYNVPSYYAQNPTNSFKNIFRFVLPQTYMPFEDRIRVLEKICKKHKDQGFKLAMLMLSSIADYVFDLNQSYSIRDCEDDELEERFRYPKPEEIGRVVELALCYCAYSTSEVCELVRVIQHSRMECQRDRIVEHIVANKGRIEDVREVCRVSREVICNPDVLNSIVKPLTPDDVIQKHLWLFDKWYPAIPGVEHDDNEDMLQIKREDAIKDILAERGVLGMKEYAAEVKEHILLGDCFCRMDGGKYLPEIAAWCEDGEKLCQFVSSYLNILLHVVIQEKNVTIETIRDLMALIPNQVLQARVLSTVHYLPAIGCYVETLEPSAWDEYWRNWDRLSIMPDLEFVVLNLMRVERLEFAIELIYTPLVKNKPIAIRDEVVYDLLLQYEMDPRVGADSSIASQVRELIVHLEKTTSEKVRSGLYGLELKYYGWYDKIEPFDRVSLSKDMVTDPELMTRLIGICELPDEYQGDELVHYCESIGDELLWNTNNIPYVNESGNVDYAALKRYVYEVLKLCENPVLKERAYKVIGVLLANIPIVNGMLDEELCELIEQLDSQSLDEAYECHIYAQEGATIRPCTQGGDIEYAKEEEYKAIAREQWEYSHVSSIYEAIAKYYHKSGEAQDRLAKKYEDM